MVDFSNHTATVRTILNSSGAQPRCMLYGLGALEPGNEGVTPYLDVSKYSQWRNDAGTAATSLTYDAYGRPVQPASGQTEINFVIYRQPSLGLVYVVKWKSLVPLTISVGGNIASVTNHTWDGYNGSATITLSSTTAESFIVIGRTDGTEDVFGLDDFNVIPQTTTSRGTTFQEELDAGHYWVPDFIDPIKNDPTVHCIRFMDQNGMNNGNNLASALQPLTDTDVLGPTKQGYNALIPPEVVADFANQTGIPSIWVCMPTLADSAYIVEYMTRLKNALTGGTVVVVELVNEYWNNDYPHAQKLLSKFYKWMYDQGYSGVIRVQNVSITEGANSITLPTGEGANVTEVDTAWRVGIGGLGTAYQPTSVSGDDITFASYNDIDVPTGTYDVYFGLYSLLPDAMMKYSEDMRQAIETVFTGDDADRFMTVIPGQAVNLDAGLFTIGALLEVDSEFPLPATRHEIVSFSSYFGSSGVVTQAMIDKRDGDDLAGALEDLHAAALSSLASTITSVQGSYNKVVQYHPSAQIWAYEGGSHILHYQMTVSGAVAKVNPEDHAKLALPLMEDYFDSSYMEELVSEWIAFQRAYFDIGSLLQWYDNPDFYGIWGKTLNNVDYTQNEWGSKIDAQLAALTYWRAATFAERNG
ncbi:hypothetical protein [Pseudooceanicola sp.]|uniref:hypothetical protein n=1 Tax=Pseudooceanicola sp. TaxID=1914328 RepID=UPI0035C6AF94